MAYQDLQHFIQDLNKRGLLHSIDVEVDSYLEMTEIADRVVKQRGNALLFTKVKNSNYPVLMNSMGSYERMALALGLNKLDDIAEVMQAFMSLWKSNAGDGQALKDYFPRKIDIDVMAPCQEVIEEPNLDELPILHSWPQDGGRAITLPLVITQDPETGQQNVGMYRLHVFDQRTTGIHWHWHKDGREAYEKYRRMGHKRMPVAVALGGDPALIYSATAPLPKEIDEMLFAGFLRKEPIRVVKCVTSDILVPADAEFVLEGYVELDEMRAEGPYANHTGYYSAVDDFPVFHIEKVTRKMKPVYPTTIVGQPPQENCYIAKATERTMVPVLRSLLPEIVDIHLPLEGIFNNCAIVSIKKAYPKHAQKVMYGLWGLKHMMYTKMLIVVDEQVSPHDVSKVMWKVFNNIDPKRDLVLSEGPLDLLDCASNTAHYGHRLGIDATKKWASEGHTRNWPDDVVMPDSIKTKVDERWAAYGFVK
ncbi:menaquinone biosynthesis decarboxylase [Paenibacillus sp. N1-5-1-14]|uniref:menaquinone biosynthesis decarboxylase n=1 Tax=Paenibacillus radicibacter TaxID=2972488 RepID=UPI002158CA9F|nr:menaquinone biosynthesis decarboxylase [Paenibacillus radicibacter]MCR8645277.1 menaquinone biosynthesis decarboxylase [Paenibacillus radicibacter]